MKLYKRSNPHGFDLGTITTNKFHTLAKVYDHDPFNCYAVSLDAFEVLLREGVITRQCDVAAGFKCQMLVALNDISEVPNVQN